MTFTDTEFVSIVDADIRGVSTPEQAEMLRDPASLRDWLAALDELLDAIDAKLAANKMRVEQAQLAGDVNATPEWLFEQKAWQARATTRKRHVESRRRECLGLLEGSEVAYAELAGAVRAHRREIELHYVASRSDEALWERFEQIETSRRTRQQRERSAMWAS